MAIALKNDVQNTHSKLYTPTLQTPALAQEWTILFRVNHMRLEPVLTLIAPLHMTTTAIIRCAYILDVNTNNSLIYTIICLKSVCLATFAQCSSQFWLNRVGRCLKLIASTLGTFCHEFASQFGLDFFIRQKTANHCRPHTSIRAAEINNGIGSGRTEETR